jgi:hypothetical protein
MDAGMELASQLIENGGDIDCLDWGGVGTSAVGGLGSGAVGGVFGKAFTTLKGLRRAARGGGTASRSLDDLVKTAQQKYPGKAGKIEDHHITPRYLGGDPNGPTARIDAAYHQEITNAFRAEWGYGNGKPSPERLQDIMRAVYERFPLPNK